MVSINDSQAFFKNINSFKFLPIKIKVISSLLEFGLSRSVNFDHLDLGVSLIVSHICSLKIKFVEEEKQGSVSLFKTF